MDTITIRQVVDLLEGHGLLVGFSCPEDRCDQPFTSLTFDSKQAVPGALFLCKGAAFKAQYLQEALDRGAGAYLSQQCYPVDPSVPYVLATDIRKAMSLVAIAFYHRPFEALTTVGITGTKGKTTTTYFMKNILDAHAGCRTAVLSTIDVYTGVEEHDSHLTTPESADLQKYLSQARDSHIPYLTMEVSSQATKLDRVYGMTFDCGMFLNISEDHIGPTEHADFEEYFSCKLKFLTLCRTAILNRACDHFDRVLATARTHCSRVVTFGPEETRDPADPDSYGLSDIVKEEEGFSFTVRACGYEQRFAISMEGRFNCENALAALATARTLGVGDEAIAQGLLRNAVRGRMNVLRRDGITVVVDYAHNHFSFSRLYQSLKADYPGHRIVAVFGCPGDHATQRRKELGTLAGQNANYVYLTADDPCYCDPADICREIASFIEPYGTPYEIIPDRAQAVETAIRSAQPGDVIILAAKGEEVYQRIRGQYVPYESDIAIARRLLHDC